MSSIKPFLLSVVVPTYNSQDTLPRTLASFEVIGVSNRERVQIVFSDDGSTDKSVPLLRSFAENPRGLSCVLLLDENGGVSAARNRALRAALGEWILFVDADDELAFDPIDVLSNAKPEITMFTFPVERCRLGKRWRKCTRYAAPQLHWKNIHDALSSAVPLHICAGIFRRDLATAPFSEDQKYLEDWAYWWDNLSVFEKVERANSRKPLAIIHVHNRNRTGNFAAVGSARAHLAGRLLLEHSLSRSHRNNLLMQRDIGLILQGYRIRFANALRFPCSLTLFFKFVVYWAFRERVRVLNPYNRPE